MGSKTKMNAGSSRSHCALILTMHQTDLKKNDYVNTTFTVIDMAGSERVTKTGAEFIAPTMISTMMRSGKPLTDKQKTGAEGGLINFELSELATQVQIATEAHVAKRRYVKPKGTATTDTIQFIGRCLDGNCLLGMFVCISQAPQNGWETWFSCTYGEKLSKLKSPLKKVKTRSFDKEIVKARKAAEEAQKASDKTPQKGGGAAQYYELRKGVARSAWEYLKILEELNDSSKK